MCQMTWFGLASSRPLHGTAKVVAKLAGSNNLHCMHWLSFQKVKWNVLSARAWRASSITNSMQSDAAHGSQLADCFFFYWLGLAFQQFPWTIMRRQGEMQTNLAGGYGLWPEWSESCSHRTPQKYCILLRTSIIEYETILNTHTFPGKLNAISGCSWVFQIVPACKLLLQCMLVLGICWYLMQV